MTEATFVMGDLNDNLILIPADVAEELATLRKAINTSSTWGEFLAAVGDDANMREQLIEWELEPAPSDPFDADQLPGFKDGDWPTWPQQAMLEWLPAEVVAMGTVEDSRINGEALAIASGLKTEVVAAMGAAGKEVVEDQRLVERASGWA